MNIILVTADELGESGEVRLVDRRAEHLAKVLRVSVGQRVRVGVLDGPHGEAEVLGVEPGAITLRCRCEDPPEPPSGDVLLLAFARPKVLLRCLEHATALGFERIILFRSRRVEKSHLSSHAVELEVIEQHLCRGLEQSRRTRRPSVTLVQRFHELLDAHLPLLPVENRIVADAGAREEAALTALEPRGLSLVIGPEGGLIDYELERFVAAGFRLVRAGAAPLRVETALAYVTGQLRAARAARAALTTGAP